MADAILSSNDCGRITDSLEEFANHVREYFDQIESSLNVFSGNSFVQSFFASGLFGQDMEKELKELRDLLKEYFESLVMGGGLIPATKSVVEEQLKLLNSKGGM